AVMTPDSCNGAGACDPATGACGNTPLACGCTPGVDCAPAAYSFSTSPEWADSSRAGAFGDYAPGSLIDGAKGGDFYNADFGKWVGFNRHDGAVTFRFSPLRSFTKVTVGLA